MSKRGIRVSPWARAIEGPRLVARRAGGPGRREQHVHVAPLLLGLLLDRCQLLDVGEQPLEQPPPPLRICLLATTEHDRHLDLVVLSQEALDMALLRLVVVVGDLRAQLDLTDVDLLLMLACRLGPLLLLVLVLRVVEQPADRRLGLLGDHDEVEIRLSRLGERLVARQNPDLLPVGADQPYLGGIDLLVDPGRVPLGRAPVEPARDRHQWSRTWVRPCLAERKPRRSRTQGAKRGSATRATEDADRRRFAAGPSVAVSATVTTYEEVRGRLKLEVADR